MKLELAVAMLSSLASLGTAAAECAMPTWLGTADGTTLPARGTLYIYESGTYGRPGYQDGPRITFSDGVPHTWVETRVAQDLIRVDYAAGLAATMTAQVGWQPITYTLDARWTAPPVAPRVLQYWHSTSEWTCSETDSWMIQVDQPTAAFRIRWTHAGRVTEFVEPAQTLDHGRAALEIGKHDCIGQPTVGLDELAAGGELQLTAIRFDGSEVKVEGLPKFLRTDMLGRMGNGIGDALGYVQTAPAAPTVAPTTNAESGNAFLLIATAGVGLVFVGLLLAGRPRTPTPIRM